MHPMFKAQIGFGYWKGSVPLQDASQIWELEGTGVFVPLWYWADGVESLSRDALSGLG